MNPFDDEDLVTLGMVAHATGHDDLAKRLFDEAEMREYRDRNPLALLLKRIDISGLGLEGDTRIESFCYQETGDYRVTLCWFRPGKYVEGPNIPVSATFNLDDAYKLVVTRVWQEEIKLRLPFKMSEYMLCENGEFVADAIRVTWGCAIDKELGSPDQPRRECACPHRAHGEHYNECYSAGQFARPPSYADRIKILTEREAWEIVKKERDAQPHHSEEK